MSTASSSRPNGTGPDLEYKDKPRPRTPAKSIVPTHSSPYVPTPLEAILLTIYPATLVVGSLFSLLDPSARAAPYSASSQSHPAHAAPSYFARKQNLFNVFFVKIGWFWTSLSFLVFVFSHPAVGPPGAAVLTPRRLRAAVRWLLVTLWWVAVTQWFFGPPLMDRTFTLTGGQCEILATDPDSMSKKKQLLTSAACKIAKGKWQGGYDLSGHVFLLVLGGVFLWMEVLYVMMKHAGVKEERLVTGPGGEVVIATAENTMDREARQSRSDEWGIGVKFPMVVVLLSWWMLLMTAAYFHTWVEKLMGLLVASIAIFTVYYLPRGIPGLRSLIGMPGV